MKQSYIKVGYSKKKSRKYKAGDKSSPMYGGKISYSFLQ